MGGREGEDRAKGLSVRDCGSDTHGRLPLEGTGPLSLPVQPLPAAGLGRVPWLCGDCGSWLQGGLSLGGSFSFLSLSMVRIRSWDMPCQVPFLGDTCS